MPGSNLGQIEVGDVVVGQLNLGSQRRTVYGIAADTGPFDQFGEGSIPFNQKLLGRSDTIINSKDLNSIDIDLGQLEKQAARQGTLAILVLGGTKQLFKGDFSRENVKRIGRQEFARWNSGADGANRLNACVEQTTTNSQ